MELNVPSSGAVSHESPAVVQLHDDTKVPVSEIKAKLHDVVMEINRERLAKPSEVPFGNTIDDIKEQGYDKVENELLHPEEQTNSKDEQFKDIFGDTYPGSEAFAAHSGEDEMLGGIGGVGFGGGIDNVTMGFSDDDMRTLNGAANSAFGDLHLTTSRRKMAPNSYRSSVDDMNTPNDTDNTATDSATETATEEPVSEDA